LRRDRDKKDWTVLPAAGRAGPTPDWPLTRSTARERTLWERMWRRPQAIMWEQLGVFDEVALHVRTLALAERPKAPIDARRLIAQQANSLGLTIPGLHASRWIIAADAEAPRPQAAREVDATSARDRLRLVVGE
jgi:hypothetical protein